MARCREIPGSRPLKTAVAIILALATNAASAQPQCPPRYTAQLILGPPCGWTGQPSPATSSGLNDLGQACGWFSCGAGQPQPWVWISGSTAQPIGLPPGAVSALASDINEVLDGDGVGQIVGGTSYNLYRGFFYRDGQWTILEILPGHTMSGAAAVNNQSLAVGTSLNNQVGPYTAVRWPNGQSAPEALLLPTPYSEAFDCNELGAITGWMGVSPTTDARAFLFQSGNLIDLGPLPGGYTSEGWGLNNKNEVVGVGRVEVPQYPGSAYRAFHWAQGRITVLPILPGFNGSNAQAINDHSVILGRVYHSETGEFAGCIWINDQPYDIASLVVNGQLLVGYSSSAINNAGQITGEVYSGVYHATVPYILHPLPPVIGDVNCDRRVNVDDLLEVINGWGPCAQPGCAPDLNADGTVNAQDLIMVLINWTFLP